MVGTASRCCRIVHAGACLRPWPTTRSTVLGLCFFCSFWRAYVAPCRCCINLVQLWYMKKAWQKSKMSLLMLLKNGLTMRRACLRTCSLSSSQSFDIKIDSLWRANVSRQTFDFNLGCFWRANVSSVKRWDDYIYSSLYIIVPDVVGEAGASQTNEPSKGQAVRTVSIVGWLQAIPHISIQLMMQTEPLHLRYSLSAFDRLIAFETLFNKLNTLQLCATYWKM